jgi:hypothetical protein
MGPGVKAVTAVVHAGTHTESVKRSLTVLNPQAYLLPEAVWSGTGESSVRLSRVETNFDLIHEHYIVDLGQSPLQAIGRETGTFHVVKYAWPHQARSQVAVGATLVSMFGSSRKAHKAYWNQVQQYGASAGCRVCNFTSRVAKVDSRLGDYQRASFTLKNWTGIKVTQIIFARGPMLIQGWLYYDGSLPAAQRDALIQSELRAMHRIDSVAMGQLSR